MKTRDEIGEPNITAAQIHPDVLMDSLAESENSQQQPGPAAKLIDTTLFRAWMIARPSMATILFRQTNSCDPQTVTVKLTESHRYKELIDFYEGKGIHRPALELLRTFGDREEPDTRAPELFGPKRTVRYLRSLRGNGIDLILEFAVWPLKRDQTLGMEIFLSDSANAESLPRDQVIGFLSGIDSHLAMLYLEHVITDLNDVTQPHHDQYLKLLLTNAENDSHEDGKSIVERRQKLIHFLKNGHYTFRRALPLLDAGTSEALEGKAIVLGRMKQHKEVLRLYVFELRDYRKAEAYANTVELERSSGMSSHVIGRGAEGTPGQSIHRMLLEMYLAPPAPAKPDIEHALELLSHHGPRLSYSDVMDVLPDDLHLIKLKAYFTGLMRASSSRAITASIGSNLSKVNLVEVEAKLLLGKGPHGEKLSVRNRGYKVAIDEDRICGVCQKRIGRSVISVLTNQRAVHYGCSR